MSLQDEKAADLSAILAEIGEPVIWKGTTYRALVSEPTLGEELNLGGFGGTGDFTIKIPRSAFAGDLPKLGEKIEVENARYRITRLTNHQRYPMVVIVVSPED